MIFKKCCSDELALSLKRIWVIMMDKEKTINIIDNVIQNSMPNQTSVVNKKVLVKKIACDLIAAGFGKIKKYKKRAQIAELAFNLFMEDYSYKLFKDNIDEFFYEDKIIKKYRIRAKLLVSKYGEKK